MSDLGKSYLDRMTAPYTLTPEDEASVADLLTKSDAKPDASGTPSNPDYDGFRITELWTYTAVDPDDDQEGIPAMRVGDVMMPLIASDRVRIEQFRDEAQAIADETGMTITLAHFTVRTDEEVISPA